MHIRVTLKILGLLLMLFSFTLVPPMLVSIGYGDQTHGAFLDALLITFVTGFIAWLPFARYRKSLRTRDGFVVVVLFWSVLAFFGSLPLYLFEQGAAQWKFVDAVFESFSGLTTTGGTVISHIDDLPPGILYYRQQLQWIGGMGIVVLAIAILPMLGVGGMQLFRAETPGPEKDAKLTPRITETAKQLWYIYLALTLICALLYWLAGMTLFDAICHSFSTIAIGGFSTHDASIGYFDSVAIEAIAVIFMLLASINFALHFYAWHKHTIKHYCHDEELRFFFKVIAAVILISFVVLMLSNAGQPLENLRHSIFEVVSVTTTAGFATDGFSNWPGALPLIVFTAAFVGGCAGSTGGGMKAVRVLIIVKQGLRELQRLIHPNAVIQIKLGHQAIPSRITEAVWGFFSVYVFVFLILFIALMATGLDQLTAYSAVGATLNNLGPGLGDIALNYGDLNPTAKWILCLSMLLGRLEIFTLLVLFVPMFWRA